MMFGGGADQVSMHSIQNIGGGAGARFSPTSKKPFLEDHYENKIVVQRIENSRPKPRIIYKNTESSDDDDNE